MSKIQRIILIVFAIIIFIQATSSVDVEKVIATSISAIFFYVAFSKKNKDNTENSK